MARLDVQLLAQELAETRAALRAAEAEAASAALGLADAESKQRRRLAFPESFSKEEISSVEIQKQAAAAVLESARARVAGERARVRQMEVSLAQAEVQAPFAGTVSLRYLDPGAMIAAGTPIVRLLTSGDLLVRFAVPPEEAPRIGVSGRVVATVPGLGLELPGIVERIAPEIDPASRMVFLEARLSAPVRRDELAARVQPGTVVRVHER